jgi:polar amino acid transport system substrate-binding protein
MITEAIRKDLSPTGVLRAGINYGNTLFTTKDASGGLSGVAVDLMNELGKRLGIPVEQVVYATPGEVGDDAGSDKWDVTILAIEQARARTMHFSPPLTQIVATYMVAKDSRLQSVAQVDAPGVRIAVAEKAGYDLYLTRTLGNASLVRGRGSKGAFDMFAAGEADALAGLEPMLADYLDKMPGARLLDGRFMTVNHGFAIPRERPAGAEYMKAFADDMVASGFLVRSIARHAVRGLAPAK